MYVPRCAHNLGYLHLHIFSLSEILKIRKPARIVLDLTMDEDDDPALKFKEAPAMSVETNINPLPPLPKFVIYSFFFGPADL